ncbi:MAG: flagellar biosynthetic protein FliR [Bryobacteraceae bacterium]|jgi:flagellar biosynthetic protein FliR
MPADLSVSAGTVLEFLLVLARVSGAMVLVPLPGFSGTPGMARAAFSLAFALALAPRWPHLDGIDAGGAGTLAAWAVAEAAIGVAIGLSAAMVLEVATFAAQMLGIPAGYGYAQTVDPNTQADAGILLVVAQLMAGMLFFALGMDRQVLRLFSTSLERIPPGTYVFQLASAGAFTRLAGNVLAAGARLALPVVALLVMVDVALALMGRLNAQLQLLSLAFPAKMLTALFVLAAVLSLYPRLLAQFSLGAWRVAQQVLGL